MMGPVSLYGTRQTVMATCGDSLCINNNSWTTLSIRRQQ